MNFAKIHKGNVAVLALMLIAAGLLSACDNSLSSSSDEAEPVAAETSDMTTLDVQFKKAADEFEVPAALLKGIAYAETNFYMVEGHQEFEGRPAAYGVMALRGGRP